LTLLLYKFIYLLTYLCVGGQTDGEKELKRCIVESFKKVDDDFLLEAKQK